jgi:deoxycytidylate deaminase
MIKNCTSRWSFAKNRNKMHGQQNAKVHKSLTQRLQNLFMEKFPCETFRRKLVANRIISLSYLQTGLKRYNIKNFNY